jgi:hypothetical protein
MCSLTKSQKLGLRASNPDGVGTICPLRWAAHFARMGAPKTSELSLSEVSLEEANIA